MYDALDNERLCLLDVANAVVSDPQAAFVRLTLQGFHITESSLGESP
jgi:hypothetical protein